MATADQIREGLQKMAKSQGPAVSNIATVKSVDEKKATCVLIDEDGQEIFEVRLRPVLTGNKSFILLPKVGSQVLAVRVEDDDDWMVIACDEIEKVGYYLNGVEIEFKEKLKFNANGEKLATLMDDLFSAIGNMVFTTPNGPTTSLVNAPQFEALKERFTNLLES
jgi:hypothetical protein